MISISEAFEKFKSRLEPGEREQNDAVSRRDRVKTVLQDEFHLDRVIITGSYARWTKIRYLHDVDLFCILNAEKEGDYLKKSSRVLLDKFGDRLAKEFGWGNVKVWDKCVSVSFGEAQNDEDKRVFSVDVVPAYEDGKAYKIPDAYHPTGWMKTDPEIHKDLATKRNDVMDGKWVPLVKMAKKCNEFHGKPVEPSFLLETMALKLVNPPFAGGYPYEIKSLFASVEQQIGDEWPDPAKIGPSVSDHMNTTKVNIARQKLNVIRRSIDQAMLYERQG